MAWFLRAPITVRTMTVTSALAVLSLIAAQFLTPTGFANPFLVLAVFLLAHTIIIGATSHVEKETIAGCWRALIGAFLQVVTAFVVMADAVMMSADEYQHIAQASDVDRMATVPLGTAFALLFWSMIVVVLMSWSVISGEQAISHIREQRRTGSKHLRKHLRKQRRWINLKTLRGRWAAKKHQAALLLDLEHFFKGSDHGEKD